MSSQTFNNVLFCAVMRLSDKELLGFYVHSPSGLDQQYERVAMQVGGSNRIAQTPKLSIVDKDLGTLHYDSDQTNVYMVMVSSKYPQRTAFRLLEDLRDGLPQQQGQNKLPLLKRLCAKYDDLASVDKIHGVIQQVDEVKGVMQNNINSVLTNIERFEDLENKTDELKEVAGQFKKDATKLKRMMWMRNCKMWTILIIVIIAILLYFIIPLVR
eukprot:gnl/Hemi2/10059_TR3485_c0_g1_i1.p1 gnl/Hemi2/10059_TR3485_c0_g1~~gnl/Hemi2/10059_TR3485_c0_g1_i1.p1  ORF type:complete len:213 (+),score=48.22 gnl/Hemi2/10059_TR3485_c0_g1_i1:79-717(+)